MFIMLFSVFFSPNIIVLNFWVFKVSLFLSNQLSIFFSSSLTTFSTENELLPEAKSAVSSAKRRVFKFETFERSFMYRGNKIGPRTLPCGTP